MRVVVKRVYEVAAKSDGFRVLVDRLWPRGLSKEKAGVDLWLRDIAPSTPLRRWFGHDPARWAEFQSRYRRELVKQPDLLSMLVHRAKRDRVTLLYSASDERRNQAVVLKAMLSRRCRVRTGRS